MDGSHGSAADLARCYDLDMLDVAYDAELYLRLAHEAGGSVLELGVGSGRLAVPLALAGHRVVGVDHDGAMLARARRAWEQARGSMGSTRVELVEGDLATFRSPERFGLAFIAVNTFLLAPDDEARLTVLSTMLRHLVRGGLAAIEMSTPGRDELDGYDGRLRREWVRHDEEVGADVEKRMAARYEERSRTVVLEQVFSWRVGDEPVTRVRRTDELHLITPDRLAELARRAGFGEVTIRGDHLATPYGAGSHRAIVVARSL